MTIVRKFAWWLGLISYREVYRPAFETGQRVDRKVARERHERNRRREHLARA